MGDPAILNTLPVMDRDKAKQVLAASLSPFDVRAAGDALNGGLGIDPGAGLIGLRAVADR